MNGFVSGMGHTGEYIAKNPNFLPQPKSQKSLFLAPKFGFLAKNGRNWPQMAKKIRFWPPGRDIWHFIHQCKCPESLVSRWFIAFIIHILDTEYLI